MKTINISFEDKEFDVLMQRKGEMTWREYILSLNHKKGGDKYDARNETIQTERRGNVAISEDPDGGQLSPPNSKK